MAKSKGLTVGISADLKDFKKGLTEVNKEINKTSKKAEQYKKELSFKYDATNFLQAQKNAQLAIQKTTEKAQTLKNKINELEQNGGKGTKDWEYLAEELEKTNLKAQQLKRNLDDINKIKADNLKNTFNNIGQSVQDLGRKLAPVSAIAGAGLFGLYKIGKGAIETADNLQTLADRLGLSVEKLQEYSYIAKQTDIEQQEFNNILKKTNGALASLSSGNITKQAQALERLGVSSEQAKKGLSQNIDLIFESLASIQDPMEQLAIANELVGEKVGQALVPMLRLGANGINQLREEIGAFGLVSGENVAKLSQFDNVLNKIKEQIKNIKINLGVALLPVMEKVADLLETKVLPVVSQITEKFKGLNDNTKVLITGITGFTALLSPMLLVGGQLIKVIGGLFQSIGILKGALTALMAHPIVLAVVGVIALITILILKNEKLKNSILDFLKVLGGAFMPLFDALKPVIEIVGNLLDQVAKTLGNTLAPIFNILGKIIARLLTNQLRPLMLLFKIGSSLIKALEKPLLSIATVAEKILVPAFEALESVIEGAFKVFDTIVKTFLDGVSLTVNFIIDMINTAIDAINTINFLKIGGTIEHLEKVDFSKDLGYQQDTAPKVNETIKNSTKTIEKATENNTTLTNIYNYNTDNSNKNPTINITIENYGEKVDIEELTKKINIELAKAM